MPMLQVAFKATKPKTVVVQADNAALPGGGYVDAGSFDHPDPVYPGSLVLYHGVRDLLYKLGELDMQPVSITLADGVVAAYVTEIRVLAPNLDLQVQDELYKVGRINAQAWPPGAADKTLTYASSVPAVATVDADGVVTAVSEGATEITITAAGSEGTPKLTKKVTVSVGGKTIAENVHATSIDVTPATVSRTVGQTQQLTVARTPANAIGTVTYASSDATKATVNSTGLITAVAVGSATITATLEGKTDTCVVTVTA